MKRRAMLIAVLAVAVASWAGVGCSAEPYRGRVLDDVTKEPISGVVVTVVWLRETSLPGGDVREEFHKAIEVLTDSQGRFTVPDVRQEWTRPGVEIEDAAPTFFKPGYIQRHIQFESSEGESKSPIIIYMKRRSELTEDDKMSMAGTEDPAFQTARHPLIPGSAIPKLLRAIDEDRQLLGLPSLPRRK
ncbi:MAG: carboxypeptidase regulatory-like domain-containing protein [Candidatus Rokubacteria bacterium]|nr:carboxypeptidase regulatory-like domain-containing protein [Candidatus Rokubacteria bacterium]